MIQKIKIFYNKTNNQMILTKNRNKEVMLNNYNKVFKQKYLDNNCKIKKI